MAKVAVVLSGCGRMDGSEVHESTLSLLYIAKGGAEYQCFAPGEPQVQVVDHVTNDLHTDSERNQMIEAARIARGDIEPITDLNAEDYDGLVIPGGSGAFISLSNGEGDVHPELRRVVSEFANADKPIAAICIAPVLIARILGDRGIRLTIGNDADSSLKITRAGAMHIECGVDTSVSDLDNKIVSTPAYMLGPGIADISDGIQSAIETLLAWIEEGK